MEGEEIQQDKVYHASSEQGLNLIKPSESTHGEKWVYATLNKAFSAAFLGAEGGDFACHLLEVDGKLYICERFEGAFDLRYEGVSGSIYVLPGEKFVRRKDIWSGEVVSDEEVEPIKEIQIDDAKQYLLDLKEKGQMEIDFYPEKPDIIPEDDEDLVMRAIVWAREGDEVHKERILEQVERYHPNLLTRVKKGLKEGKYEEGMKDLKEL